MAYTLNELETRTGATTAALREFISVNKIRIDSTGSVSARSYSKIIQWFKSWRIPPKPFFTTPDQRVILYHRDAVAFLRSLPSESVDLIVTDPAYSGMNQKLKLGKGKIIGEYKKAGEVGAKWFGEFHDTEENYRVFLQQCQRVLRPDRHIYLMFDSYSMLTLGPMVREVFDVKNILCWDKVNIGLGHYFRRRHELILFASKGKRSLNFRNIPDVWRIKRVVRMRYPTQKPVEVFEMMIRGSAHKDYVVCDPFMGSGSSAIAAMKLQCRFVGCDISMEAITSSTNRIKCYLVNSLDAWQPQPLTAD